MSSTSSPSSSLGGSSSSDKNGVIAITGEIQYDSPLFKIPESIRPWKIPLLSYTTSMISTTLGFPLDSIKTRMQTHKYNNAFSCLRITVQNEGFRGLFRGLLSPLVTSSISKSMGVSLYSHFKPTVSRYLDFIQSGNVIIDNFPKAFATGCCSNTLVSFFACPFELAKIFQQLVLVVGKEQVSGMKSKLLPTTFSGAVKSVVKSQGFFGMYSGIKYHILRDAISSGLFFATYETTKMTIHEYIPQLKLIDVQLSGVSAGVFSWILIFPLDTVKSQYQRDIIRNIIREQSGLSTLDIKKNRWSLPIKELYRGIGPSLTRAVFSTTIFFTVFEALMRNIE